MGRQKAMFLLASIFFLLVLALPGYCSEKPTCAVLLFHPDMASSNIYESQMISSRYAELLDRLDMFDVIDYKKIDEILINKNVLDLEKTCTDLGCALKIGNKIGVDFLIYGIIGNVGNLYSLDTTLVNIAGGNETQHAVYDFEGTQEEFAKNAPAENMKSLFGIQEIPEKEIIPVTAAAVTAGELKQEETQVVEDAPVAPAHEELKDFRVAIRGGIAFDFDNLEPGAGIELKFKKLSFAFLANGDGFATGLSYYLHQEGNSPFFSVVGSYYDTKNKYGIKEIGRIYGILLGYRVTFDSFMEADMAKNIDTRIGLGAGYVNWDERGGTPYTSASDEEFIPLFEVTLGYTF
ncbi:MAG: hypothetical protein HF978_16245 [Desulfobacteraceae bacterium]|nr:hypothetical protein [Desulfobacteraceae bacterium]MBC2757094.1 hypothetical protein [Desulfobacteraceae bacterium]MBC2763690.1 hypothetical protein [ANME-2 cluster archaeon]